jgi:hypothetical protein
VPEALEPLENQPPTLPFPGGSSTGSSNPADLPPDLAQLVTSWATLPEHIRAAVLALVNTANRKAG